MYLHHHFLIFFSISENFLEDVTIDNFQWMQEEQNKQNFKIG
jgi:hypothetical protein